MFYSKGGFEMAMPYVVDLSKSPSVKMVPLPVNAVKLPKKSFWGRYRHAMRTVGIPKLFRFFEEKGVLDNFRRVSGRKKCPRQGTLATDSDLYKWMEGAAFSLVGEDDPAVRDMLETAITEVLAAQGSDGYLNTYFTKPGERFTSTDGHEMYIAGHYFQAAVAIHRCLGDDRVLKSALRFADYLFDRFGPGMKKTWCCGHPEIEMALVELYRTTGDKKYLHFSRHLLDQLNIDASWKTPWSRDITVPFTIRTELFGHAVRNMYLAAAGSDLWAETGDKKIAAAVVRLWENMVERKIYLTGGLGSRFQCEAMGLDYELPNQISYAETCAAIGNVFWNYRNLQITGQGRFTDWMEQTLYNGVLAGVSLDCGSFFYVNPMISLGNHQRSQWLDVTCCPTNLARLLSSMPGYFYSSSGSDLWVHLYDSNTAQLGDLTLTQQTDYPSNGRVHFTFELKQEKKLKLTLNLRIPGWAETFSIRINGRAAKVKPSSDGYVQIHRVWQNKDTVELLLPMPARTVFAHPRVPDNFHRAALMRGPMVFCLEETDNDRLESVHLAALNSNSISKAKTALAKGFKQVPIPAITFPGVVIKPEKNLYYSAKKYDLKTRPTRLTAVPYHAWANRNKSPQMTVWLPFI
jgi:uncharacterized protein